MYLRRLLSARLLRGALAASMLVGPLLAVPDAAQAFGTGTLTVTNRDVLPSNSAVVLSRIQTPADTSQRVHDTATLRLTNSGTAGLTVSALTVTGAFTVTSPWKLPFTLSSGSSVDITVTFIASNGDWKTGSVAVAWNNGTAQTTAVALTGWFQKYSEHNLEPHLGALVQNFGYGTVMPTAIYSRGAYQSFSSDEVLNAYWSLLDPSQPARITEIAAWRGYPSSVVVSSFAKGSSATTTPLFTGLKNDAQSAYPRSSSWGRGTATFPITQPTGLKVDKEFSDATLNDQSLDRASGCTATQCGQHLRVFQARTPAGVLMPGSYLIAEDAGGVNYDYNDNVFLLENVKPA